MKALKTMGILFILVLLGAIILGLVLPGEVIVNRSVTIQTPVSQVFHQVSDASLWPQWSPWAAADKPDETKSTEAEKCCWSGASLGNGCMEITSREPMRKLETNMQFRKLASGTGSWLFIPQSDTVTEVQWTMRADVSKPVIIGPLVGLAMNGVVGNMLETGLEGLKTSAEQPGQIVYQ